MDSTFTKLKELQETKKIISMTFSTADFNAMVYKGRYQGINILLPMSCYLPKTPITSLSRYKGRLIRLIDNPVDVIVSEINEAENTVLFVNAPFIIQHTKKIQDGILEALAKNEPYKCKMRVSYIVGEAGHSGAVGKIVGTALTAVLWCGDWSTEYIDDIRDRVNPGDVIEVAIIANNEKNEIAPYKASRAVLLPNPWEGLDKWLSVGDYCNVQVRRKLKNRYLGTINGFPDIPVSLRIPKDSSRFVGIFPGRSYRCIISILNVEKKQLVVAPYDILGVKSTDQ